MDKEIADLIKATKDVGFWMSATIETAERLGHPELALAFQRHLGILHGPLMAAIKRYKGDEHE